MEDNVSEALNGDIMPGDPVLSVPGADYACLAGTVLSVEKPGSTEHDTNNDTDDIHVNFMIHNYSESRTLEIDAALAALYGDPAHTLDRYPLDDVIMAPDMLIRIDGISPEDFRSILDSREKAEAYCAAVLGAPAWEDAKSPRDLLAEKLDAELGEYHRELLATSKENIIGMAFRAAAMSDAHFRLTEEMCELSDTQIAALLEAPAPLYSLADTLRDSFNESMLMLDTEAILEAAGAAAPPAWEPADREPPVRQREDGKTSVLDALRRARENPPQRADKPDRPGHKKSDYDL